MKTLHLLAAAVLLATATAHGQVVGPGYSGINRLTLPGNSDSIIALPFARPETVVGLVQSATGTQITFQGTPGWDADQFVRTGAQTDTFYALIESGTQEGSAYFVTGNGGNTITVDLEGETLTALASGDRVAIIPCWTLATLFPGGTGVHTTQAPGNRLTEVLFPNFNATGINSSAAGIFYFFGGHWLKVGDGSNSHDHDILLPDALLTVRHNLNSSTELVCSGQVLPCNLRSVLGVNATGKRDNFLGLQRPIAVTLGASGLVSSGAFAASPTPGNRTDELLVFDNSIAARNKSASAIYYYWNNAWRKVGGGTAVFDSSAVFTPGAGFVIRKNLSATAPSWTNAPNY